MAEDWLADVRKYVADADEAVVDKLVKYLGIALRNRDSSLVAFSDSKETDRVRENYLKKKLGLTHSDADLDAAIAAVGERMKADRTKNRVTVYYLLAEHFGSLNVFGGVAGAAAAVGLAGAMSSDAAATAPPPSPPPAAAHSSYDNGDGTGDVGSVADGSSWGWLKWVLLALLAAALIFFLLRYCSSHDEVLVDEPDAAAVTTEQKADDGTTQTAAAEPSAAVPAGAGVTTGEKAGKPMLTVYFDTGKSDVTNDLATAAAKVRDYVASNAGAKLAVSGYNDPTGNAAVNAELSKKRAQGVKAALEKAGIPAASIELVKPSDTTDTSGDNTAARRVEVTVQ